MKIKEIRNIIKGCIRGDAESQFRLYKLYAPKMMGLCLRYTKNKADAEDVLQEGFIKVFENIYQLKKAEKLEWWLKRIFINEALQLLKNRKNIISLDVAHVTNLSNRNAEEILGSLSMQEITGLIRELPSGMQTILNLYIIDGLPHKEIAKMLGISEGTSKSQLHVARKLLQEKLIRHNL